MELTQQQRDLILVSTARMVAAMALTVLEPEDGGQAQLKLIARYDKLLDGIGMKERRTKARG